MKKITFSSDDLSFAMMLILAVFTAIAIDEQNWLAVIIASIGILHYVLFFDCVG